MNKCLKQSNRYLKELSKILKRDTKQFDMDKLRTVIELLQKGAVLPAKYNNHPLHGTLKGFMGLHITPDWVLVYRTDNEYVYLQRIGTHSDIY
jgi:mRNA interferase YafQ